MKYIFGLLVLMPGALNAQPKTRSQTRLLNRSLSMWVHVKLVYNQAWWQQGGAGKVELQQYFGQWGIHGFSCQEGFSGTSYWGDVPVDVSFKPLTVTLNDIKASLKVKARGNSPQEESQEISIPLAENSSTSYTFGIKDYTEQNVQVIVLGEISNAQNRN